MNRIRKIIRNISPQMLIFVYFAISAWLILGAMGQLIAIWTDLFSSEEVINLW